MNCNEALSELKIYADLDKAQHLKKFFKSKPGEYGFGDKFLGVTVPHQRLVAKKFNYLALPEVEKLLQHEYHEARLTAVFVLVYRIKNADQFLIDEIANLYLKNIEHINNWDIVDSSCYFILARFLENRNRNLLYEFAKSVNLWKRRIAIITCYHFIKQKDFKDALAISEILLFDKEDLIQKAVGWMLREIGNRDQHVEEEFLKKEKRYKKMPRTALRYAIEKFDEPLRKNYLNAKV